MTIQFCSLGSGSSGNAYWVSGDGMELLVDFGLSRPQIISRLAYAGTSIDHIDAIFCTHAHRDHFISLRPIGATAIESNRIAWERTKDIPFFMTQRSFDFAMAMQSPTGRKLDANRWTCVDETGEIQLKVGGKQGLTIQTTSVFHDCPGTVALKITSSDGASLGVATDIGIATPELVEMLRGSQALLLEFNHDPELLTNGPYPRKVKKRILGNYGHLSNGQGSELLRQLIHPNLQHVGLIHISQTNNRPEIAISVAQRVLDEFHASASLFACSQDLVSPVLKIVV